MYAASRKRASAVDMVRAALSSASGVFCICMACAMRSSSPCTCARTDESKAIARAPSEKVSGVKSPPGKPPPPPYGGGTYATLVWLRLLRVRPMTTTTKKKAMTQESAPEPPPPPDEPPSYDPYEPPP